MAQRKRKAEIRVEMGGYARCERRERTRKRGKKSKKRYGSERRVEEKDKRGKETGKETEEWRERRSRVKQAEEFC